MKAIEEELQARERTAPKPTPHKRVSKESPTAAALLTGSGHLSCMLILPTATCIALLLATLYITDEAQARRQSRRQSLQRSGDALLALDEDMSHGNVAATQGATSVVASTTSASAQEV